MTTIVIIGIIVAKHFLIPASKMSAFTGKQTSFGQNKQSEDVLSSFILSFSVTLWTNQLIKQI